MKKPSILIVGFGGFIGHHFTKNILQSNEYQVKLIDYLDYSGNRNRIDWLIDNSKISSFWDYDLSIPVNWNSIDILNNKNIFKTDCIINFASISDVDYSINNPIQTTQTNTHIILNVLELARKINCKKLIHISTDEVFGEAISKYKFHEYDCLNPSNPYSASKASQEMIINSYHRTYGIRPLIIRTMNNFGERQNNTKFIPKSIEAILNNKMVEIYCKNKDIKLVTGSRSWIYVENFCSAIQFLMDKFLKENLYLKYHVTGQLELDNLELIDKIGKILKKKFRCKFINFYNSRPGCDLKYSLDDTRLKALGWKPQISFEEGLERTVKSYVK